MRKIYLTERDIHRMVVESVQTLLLEVLTPDEIYNKYYKDTIDRDIFDAAIAADPTSYNPQGEINKVGSYVKWILKLYKNGSWKAGDSVETKDLLSKFNKLKTHLSVEQRDINRYSSVRELYNILQPYLGTKSRSEIKQEAEKVYEDEQWLIIIPHTEEAACSYGKGTRWCTAAENSQNMFNYYNNQGPLYINIDHNNNRKYQFHFESGQFMDEEDEPIQLNTLPWTEGALAYYKSINKEIYFKYDWVGEFDYNGIAEVKLNGKRNWFSLKKQGLLSPNQWFDGFGGFDSKGISMVKLNGKYTWFSLEKQDYLFPNQWFDYASGFDSNGIARVRLNDKDNWFSLKKQGLLSPNQWFDSGSYFDNNGIAMAALNGKWYYFTVDGVLLDYNTLQPLSNEALQSLQKQQQIAEMTNRLVRNYLR